MKQEAREMNSSPYGNETVNHYQAVAGCGYSHRGEKIFSSL